jgi:uncharacterized protein (UPF0333 family)
MTGLALAAAGAGAYFLLSPKYATQRRRLAEKVKTSSKKAIDTVSTVAGETRKNVKTALADVSEVAGTAAKKL